MKRSLLGTVVFVVCASTLGACKIIEQLKKSGAAAGASAAAAAAGPSSEEEKDDVMSEKLDGYIYCMNYETRSAYRSRNAYLEYVDEQKGPTGKEPYIGVQSLSPDACLKRIDEAKAKPPSVPDLEAAAEGYKTALAALHKITSTAHDYYDQKDYKDDKFAKGQQMHKPLLEAYSAFEKADKVFDEKVTTLNEGIRQRRLVRLKADPKAELQYDIAKSMDDAKKLIKFTDVDSFEKLDGAGFGTALAAYEQSVNTMNAYISSHAPEADKVMMLSSFTGESKDFLKSAKELVRRKRDNKGFKGESGSPENIDGHPAQVLAKYNEMINSSNNLRFR
jgi:hypothetical protein